VMGKRGEITKKQRSNQVVYTVTFFFHDVECGTPSHNSPRAIQDLTVH
jgi:hypothetical protein